MRKKKFKNYYLNFYISVTHRIPRKFSLRKLHIILLNSQGHRVITPGGPKHCRLL